MKKLSEVLEEFLEKNEGLLKYNTLQSYKYAWLKLIKAIDDKLIFEVNSNHIEDFRSWLLKQTDKPKSVDTSMRNAAPIMAWSIRRGYRKGNPFQGIRKPTLPEKEVRIYTDAEVCAMLRCANQLWQTKIVAAATAGMRPTEIQNLVWRDINFGEGYITIQSKKDRPDTWPWSTKNGKSRIVPMSKQFEQLLIQRLELLPEGQPYVMLTEKRYYDLQQKRVPPFKLSQRLCNKPDGSMRRWNTIMRKAKIWDDRRFYDLRSTAITNWILSGMTPQEVQKMAGHSDIKITMRYYAACRPNYIEKAKLEIGATGLEPATS